MSNYATLLGAKKYIYNDLPFELKRTEHFKVFKNKLKSYLLQNCFYSLQEFLVTMIRRWFG
jgi:hypothetical protein